MLFLQGDLEIDSRFRFSMKFCTRIPDARGFRGVCSSRNNDEVSEDTVNSPSF